MSKRPVVLTDGSAPPQSQVFAATLPLRGVLTAAVSIVDAAVAGDGDPVAAHSAAALGEFTREEVRRRAAGLTVHVECMP